MNRMLKIKVLKLIAPTLTFLLVVAGWELVVRITNISPLILPKPSEVANVLMTQPFYLASHSIITLFEAVLGFILGGVTALGLAAMFQFSRPVERGIYPYAIALKAIPLVALAPIVVVWFGSGLLSKIILAAIITFFPILVNAIQGFESVEQETLDLMKSFSASKAQVFSKVRFRNGLPYLFAGMKISATFAVVGAVVAEFIGSQSGIGYVVKSSSYYLDTALTFAAIVAAAAAGLLFFWFMNWLEWAVVFWTRLEKDVEGEPNTF